MQYDLTTEELSGTETILENLNEERVCDVVDDVDDMGCKCDRLLQLFHRFDESIGLEGKWAGGSVTSVCRGWGTSNVSFSN